MDEILTAYWSILLNIVTSTWQHLPQFLVISVVMALLGLGLAVTTREDA